MITTHRPETWADIQGFPDYQISDRGQVRSQKSGQWRVLRATPHSKTGYLAVSLRVDGRYVTRSVHRLVAVTFLGRAEGRDVNHKNGDKHDNRLVNLEYLTRGENHRHAYRNRLREPVGKKLTDDEVRLIASLKGQATQKELAERFGVSRSTIGFIHQKKRHKLLLT